MREIIRNVLKGLGLAMYFVTRGTNNGECVIYNYTSAPLLYADNTLKGTSYTILLNVRVKSNVDSTNKSIIEAFNNAGINGGTVQATQLENVSDGTNIQYYNTAITFNGYMPNN